MGDGDEAVEALQNEAEMLKSKLLIERSKVSEKNCKYNIYELVLFLMVRLFLE